MALLRDKSLIVEPGTYPSYSNLAYILMGRLLTESGSPLPGACNSHTKPMSRRFHRPVYFYPRKLNVLPVIGLRGSTSQWESGIRGKFKSKNKFVCENAVTGI